MTTVLASGGWLDEASGVITEVEDSSCTTEEGVILIVDNPDGSSFAFLSKPSLLKER